MALSSLQTSPESNKNEEFPETEIGTHGLKKRLLVKGTSWKSPSLGDEVEVHFSGQIQDGACIGLSRENGHPFKLKVGQGEVIKGFEEGVATMKEGERAIFTVPPKMAYGEAGSPPLVPSNATLIFDIELLSWRKILDLTMDGGILKKTLAEGKGWATPKDGDEVLVKYEARLDNGAVVSGSNNGVEFYVGDDFPCPAISRAVKTMRCGETAELAVKFSYGFSGDGTEATTGGSSIPPYYSQTMKVELVSWRSVIDVTGDKKVLKKIVKEGDGIERPGEGSQVKVTYMCTLEDGTVIERQGTIEEPFEFTTQQEEINEDLEKAIMTMKKGEQATVIVSQESLSYPGVSRGTLTNSARYYEVNLVDFEKEKPFWKMDKNEKLESCERKKLVGNALFSAGKFHLASKKYEKAIKYIEYERSFTDEEKCLANSLKVSCNLNNAACKLKLGEYLDASRLCSKVLELDPSNVKALFRRSQAYLKQSELDKAEFDIKRALSIGPNNRDVNILYKELKDEQREYAKYQAEVFGTMLSRMN